MQRILANSVVIFTFTLFTSATLLFLVELIIAKMMLPKFGGTPAVWNTCMVFFQAALLAGYAYAHKITDWLGLRRQAIAQVVLILVPLVFLPFTVSDAWTPPGDQFPGFWVLWLLLVTVGMPFFAISTSAPLLQKWFSETGHHAAKDPYFLYAASNVGSMIALLGYPVFVEPYLTLSAQSWIWLAGYLVLAGLTICCAYIIWHSPAAVAAPAPAFPKSQPVPDPEPEPVTVPASETAVEEGFTAAPEEDPVLKGVKRRRKNKSGEEWNESITREPDDKPPPRRAPVVSDPDVGKPSIGTLVYWVGLAFVPSSLMLGVTTYLTTDIASIPLLWIIPLAIYLASFILVFSNLGALTEGILRRLHAIGIFLGFVVATEYGPSGGRSIRGFFANVREFGLHGALVLAVPVVLLMMLFVMATMAYGIPMLSPSGPRDLRWLLLLHLITLFCVSMVCHGELAHNRPAPRYLTGFFLCMSVGGVLGGLFNALVAPLIFNSVAEYSIVLVLACLLLPSPDSDKQSPLNYYLDIGLVIALGLAALYCLPKLIRANYEPDSFSKLFAESDKIIVPLIAYPIIAVILLAYGLTAPRGKRLNRWLDIALPLCLGILGAQLIATMPFKDWGIVDKLSSSPEQKRRVIVAISFGLLVALCYGFAERPIRLGLGVGAIFVATAFASDTSDVLHQERSFFGVLKVEDRGTYNSLLHGTTMHGQQRTDFSQLPLLMGPLMAASPLEAAWAVPYSQEEAYRLTKEPLTYYHRTGPIGQLYETFCPPERKCNVAFIGLGTGTMASYLEPRHNGTIYEIDSAIVRIAENQKYFTYLRDCRGEKQDNGKRYRIELGDARLKLKDAPDGKYRLIVVDAFSSDAIPIHLITKEAVELYVNKLAEGGVVAIHISNRHLGLAPVLANIAKELGLAALQNRDPVERGYPGKSTSDWVVIARKSEDLKALDPFFLRTYKGETGRYNGADELIRSSTLAPGKKEEWRDKRCWQPIKRRPSQSVWTDDFSNILSVLNWWEPRQDDDDD